MAISPAVYFDKEWYYDPYSNSYASRHYPGLVVIKEDVEDYGPIKAIEMAKARLKYGSTYDPRKIREYEKDMLAYMSTPPARSPIYSKPILGAAKEEEFKNPFIGKIIKMDYVGSRVSCNPPPEGSDEDILILTDQAYRLSADCKEQGFTGGEFYFADSEGKGGSEFISLRKGEVNLIVTEKTEFYDKFMLATHVCKTLNVMEKANRVMVFQAILYGNKTEGKP